MHGLSRTNAQIDYAWRKRDQDKLDSYGAAMFLDPVKTPEQDLIERDEIGCIFAELKNLLPRDECAIRMYYGLGVCEPHTLDQVGEKIGVGKERVRQMIARGERKLTRRLKKKLRPEVHRAESAERTRLLRQQRAHEAEAEAEAVQRKRAAAAAVHTTTVSVRVEVGSTWGQAPLSNVDLMRLRIRSMDEERLRYLRDWVIENKLNLMLEAFDAELNGRMEHQRRGGDGQA
ncbi:MAG: hypothetical protein EHM67_13100 [Hyphomicrobiaceae bacterium]|nr:MAG: hypothetical protein EHM67_13100 [Hyphomicrobiaceae bacterium]